MAYNLTLDGVGEKPRRAHGHTDCRCVYNKRTKKGVEICRVPKSKKHRSGTVFTGSCNNPVKTK